MNKEINVEWNWDNDECYVLIPIENQTLRMGIQLDEYTDTTIYGNIYISLYNKRKHSARNEDNVIMTGLNPFKTIYYGMKAFKFLEEAVLQGYNDRFKVIIYCSWVDNRRRDAYYKFLSKRGYRYDKLFGYKVIMKVWEKGTYEQSSDND